MCIMKVKAPAEPQRYARRARGSGDWSCRTVKPNAGKAWKLTGFIRVDKQPRTPTYRTFIAISSVSRWQGVSRSVTLPLRHAGGKTSRFDPESYPVHRRAPEPEVVGLV